MDTLSFKIDFQDIQQDLDGHKGTFILYEGTLNDDTLYVAPFGYQFGGGYIAYIEHYTFRNHWCNDKHVVKFRSIDSLAKYLNKNYPAFEFFN